MTVAGHGPNYQVDFEPGVGWSAVFPGPGDIYAHPLVPNLFFISDDEGIRILRMFHSSLSYFFFLSFFCCFSFSNRNFQRFPLRLLTSFSSFLLFIALSYTFPDAAQPPQPSVLELQPLYDSVYVTWDFSTSVVPFCVVQTIIINVYDDAHPDVPVNNYYNMFSNELYANVGGLSPLTNYTLSIAAYNSYGQSAFTNTSFTTGISHLLFFFFF